MGAQLARRAAVDGFHVVVSGRTQEKLAGVVASIEQAGGGATAVVADATSEADTEALFASAADLGTLKLAI